MTINHREFNNHRNLFVGLDAEVPLLDGSKIKYINLDNAASTPAFKATRKAVDDFLVYYSSVHRGTGYKSQLSTHVYEASRQVIMRFLGADPQTHVCIFGKNTTEAINKLARRFPFTPQRNLVLTSGMEHHSNDLPWRAITPTIHINLTPDGRLDENDFNLKLEQYGEQVALVAITGASNVTGFLNPIHRMAENAHAVGAQIVVDCAQLAPHRKIDMRSVDDPSHLDYVTISAHKMYAPFGTGALVGLRETFEQGDPDLTGGGTVEIVTLEDVVWASPPDREEAGSPNTIGAVALAASIYQLEAIGMANVADHEARLTSHALKKLKMVPSIQLYGDTSPSNGQDRLGVIPLQIASLSHFLVSAILGYEFGIGVRSGCFCAHPYILHLLKLSARETKSVRQKMLDGDKSTMPGLMRASFGLYNTLEEVDALVEALQQITKGEYRGEYFQEKSTGEFFPQGWSPEFDDYFSLRPNGNN